MGVVNGLEKVDLLARPVRRLRTRRRVVSRVQFVSRHHLSELETEAAKRDSYAEAGTGRAAAIR